MKIINFARGGLKNLYFHQLIGSDGWSRVSLSNLDVSKILSISYHRRAFMIYQKNLPYSLNLTYKMKQAESYLNPIFLGGKTGFTTSYYTSYEQSITKRYGSENDVKNEIDEILKKLEELKVFTENMKKNVVLLPSRNN